ncbi:hypothetical protein ANCCAN_26363, partial [Ancylostoma caninum]
IQQPPRPSLSWNEGWKAPFQFQPGPQAFVNEPELRFFGGPFALPTARRFSRFAVERLSP